MHRLLIIDDDPQVLEILRLTFPPLEFAVRTASTAATGVAMFTAEPPEAVLLDIRLPDQSGMATFQELHRLDPKVPVVLMTGHGTASTAIDAMRMGAFDYIVKPFAPEAIEGIVENAVETSRMLRVHTLLPTSTTDAALITASEEAMIGRCAAMQEVYRAIGRVAAKNVTTLILGETGTGKEVVARAIFQHSDRAERRFHAINCAAIPENLLESELFGHERGAFTGADQKRIGKFELCDGGTLFLDEIGDMSPMMQTKILRVLQDQRFERIGSSTTIRTDVRLIAATNRDLSRMIEAGEFRSDLFYRLNDYSIRLPPLRERGEDIELLAQFFLRRCAAEFDKSVTHFAPETIDILTRYRWPGNVRELQSVIRRTVLEATGPIVVPAFLPAAIRETRKQTATDGAGGDGESAETLNLAKMATQQFEAGSTNIHAQCIGEAEKIVLRTVLQCTGGNLSKGAEHLGISRVTLRSKLRDLGLR